MYRIDPAGSGSMDDLGTFPGGNMGASSTAVMFSPGRILQVGGGDDNNEHRRASIIDIRGSTPSVTAVAPMRAAATGETPPCSPTAACSSPAAARSRTLNAAWPTSRSCTIRRPAPGPRRDRGAHAPLPLDIAAAAGRDRAHRRRWRAGSAANLNAEIYYPPYLFDARQPGHAAAHHPAPMTWRTPAHTDDRVPNRPSYRARHPGQAGSVTHSFDMDQRFIDVVEWKTRQYVVAKLPASSDIAPPGNYMVFLIDRHGVPSEAAMLRILPE